MCFNFELVSLAHLLFVISVLLGLISAILNVIFCLLRFHFICFFGSFLPLCGLILFSWYKAYTIYKTYTYVEWCNCKKPVVMFNFYYQFLKFIGIPVFLPPHLRVKYLSIFSTCHWFLPVNLKSTLSWVYLVSVCVCVCASLLSLITIDFSMLLCILTS